MNEPIQQAQKPRRRWFQFGLRTLMAATLGAAVFFGWWSRPERLVEWHAHGAAKVARQVQRDKDKAPLSHGDWSLSDVDGRDRARGNFDLETPFGAWTYLNASGQEVLAGRVRDGRSDGVWTQWHASGGQAAEVAYREGEEEGLARTLWPNGRPRSQGEYVAGMREGEWTFWDQEGRPRSQGVYRRGREEGPWRQWDEQGTELAAREYVSGRVVVDGAAAVARWTAALAGEDVPARRQALAALGRMGRLGVPVLAQALSHPDVDLRRRAAFELKALGPAGEAAVEALVAALSDADETVQELAIDALSAIGSAARPALPRLAELVESPSKFVRYRALAARALIDPTDLESARQLLLEHREQAREVDQSGKDLPVFDERLILPLTQIVAEPDEALAVAAAALLGQLAGTLAIQADETPYKLRDVLSKTLSDDERPKVRAAAAKALGTVAAWGDARARMILEEAAKDPDPDVAAAASDALEQQPQGGFPGGGAGSGWF